MVGMESTAEGDSKSGLIIIVAAAGHCFVICIPLLFSGFKTSAERSNLDDVKLLGTL